MCLFSIDVGLIESQLKGVIDFRTSSRWPSCICQQATSEFQKPSLSKWGWVHNLSCENEFYLHENEKWFPYQRLSTYARFETAVRENSEMAYYLEGYGSQTVSWCLHHILCLLEVKVLRKKSSRHVAVVAKFLDLSKPWSCKYGRKNEKIDMCGFPMNECTRKQNVSPFFSSILRRCKIPFLSRNIVEIQNVATKVTWRHTCPLYNHPSYVFELLM